MTRIVIDLDDATAESLSPGASRPEEQLRLAAAVKLYEMGRISSGAAAEIAGVARAEFLQRMGEFGAVTFDLDEAALRRECGLD